MTMHFPTLYRKPSTEDVRASARFAPASSPKRKKMFFFSEAEFGSNIGAYGLKGASLNELQQLKLPVPDGFTITMDDAQDLFGDRLGAKEKMKHFDRCRTAIHELERRVGRKFGGDLQEAVINSEAPSAHRQDLRDALPLIVSIRASTVIDVPGAAKSILNIGMTESLATRLAEISANPRWAYDSYRRLLQLFGTTVYGIEDRRYRMIVKNIMTRAGVFSESALGVADLIQIITEFKRLATVPDDPWEQLLVAMQGIYRSWYSGTAERLKQSYGTDANSGIALVIQSMVFGNLNERCGVGFAFSRHPNTGHAEFVAEYVPCALGADVLAGSFDVKDINGLRLDNPGLYYNLIHTLKLLEKHYKDVVEIEFTVENGVFHLLNCVSARRSAKAAVTIAVNMVKERLFSEQDALCTIDPVHMISYMKPTVAQSFVNPTDESTMRKVVTRGAAASFGVACGRVVMSALDALLCKERGLPCILCLPEISADDIEALQCCAGVITSKGGLASHVAVWLREVGRPGVIAARDLVIDPTARQMTAIDTGHLVREGELLTIDGTSGWVYLGEAPVVETQPDEDFFTVMSWARNVRTQTILATVESESEAIEAIKFGADGIGLCKTESLFFGPDTINLSRFIILTKSEGDRAAAFANLYELQRDYLLRIFRAVGDRDIVVRLLSVSSSEALKSLKTMNERESLMALASKLGTSVPELMREVDAEIEPNPALGVRGCRAALLHAQWTVVQVRSITAATIQARKEGFGIQTKILLPVAFTATEVDRLLPLVKDAIAETCAQITTVTDSREIGLKFELGVTLSVPRACLLANTITSNKDIDFVTIDTDELTQLTYGIDKSKNEDTMVPYEERHLIPSNPFSVIDEYGVGELIRRSILAARANSQMIKVNAYGVHTSEARSVRFLDQVGVDTLTVPRNEWLPTAALAAAQTNLDTSKRNCRRPFRPFEDWD